MGGSRAPSIPDLVTRLDARGGSPGRHRAPDPGCRKRACRARRGSERRARGPPGCVRPRDERRGRSRARRGGRGDGVGGVGQPRRRISLGGGGLRRAAGGLDGAGVSRGAREAAGRRPATRRDDGPDVVLHRCGSDGGERHPRCVERGDPVVRVRLAHAGHGVRWPPRAHRPLPAPRRLRRHRRRRARLVGRRPPPGRDHDVPVRESRWVAEILASLARGRATSP